MSPSATSPKHRAAVASRNGSTNRKEPDPILEFRWHAEATQLLELGTPPLVLLVGEPGVGKTTFATHAAIRMTGAAPLIVNGTPETEQAHFWGRWTLAGNETRWVDGPLPQCLKSGRHLMIEEFSQIPLECRASLLSLDQHQITNPMTGEVLRRPAAFRCVAISNMESLTCRKNSGIARVLYDRFLVLECGDLPDAHVLALLAHHFPHSTQARRERVLQLWTEYRELTSKGSSGKPYLSYRSADHLLRLLEAGLEETRAVQIALVNKLLPGDPDLFSAANLKNTISE